MMGHLAAPGAIHSQMEALQWRGSAAAALNVFLLHHPPTARKVALMALREAGVVSDPATEALMEYHNLEAE